MSDPQRPETLTPQPESVGPVRDRLLAGGVIMLPTDTVYGLAVQPEHDAAIDRLFALKGRPRSRNLPVMVADISGLDGLGVIVTPEARRLLEAFAPGPLSVALGLIPGGAPPWLAGRVEIAVRIPDDDWLRDVLRATGPLLVTSANRHEQATAEDVTSILDGLVMMPDLIVDGGLRQGAPSTLINCNLPTPVIERKGEILDSDIERVLHELD